MGDMKLWILRPVEDSPLWSPWFDKAFGFVVRAKTEAEARAMAQEAGGDETGRGSYPAWTDPAHSVCTELLADGNAGVVIEDFAAA